MHFVALVFILLAGSSQALSGHSHHKARSGIPHGKFNARVRLAARAPAPLDTRDLHRLSGAHAKRDLHARKTPGTGDVTSFPSNAAPDTFTAKQGCAIWHTVVDGEVCLGLIDKSSSSFTIDKFIKFNPSVGAGCTSLQVGLAYCVDTVAGKSKSSAKASSKGSPASTDKKTNTNLADNSSSKNSTSTPTTATTSDDDEEDCDDEDESDSADDDEGDCDEDDGDGSSSDDSSNSSSDSSTSSTAPAIAVTVSVDSAPSTYVSIQKQQNQPTAAASSTSSSSSGSAATGQFNGIGTWFTQNGNAGACGNYNQDSAMIVALFTSVYSSGSHCGASVTLTNTATGKTVQAVVADECPTCGGPQDIDLSKGVFGALTDSDFGAGVVNVKWDLN